MRKIQRRGRRIPTLVYWTALALASTGIGGACGSDETGGILADDSPAQVDPAHTHSPAQGVLVDGQLVIVNEEGVHQISPSAASTSLSHADLDERLHSLIWWNSGDVRASSLVATGDRRQSADDRITGIPTLVRVQPGAAPQVTEYRLPDWFARTQVVGEGRWAVSYYGEKRSPTQVHGLQDPTLVAVTDLAGSDTKSLHVGASGAQPLELIEPKLVAPDPMAFGGRHIVAFSDGLQLSLVDLSQAQPHALVLPLAIAPGGRILVGTPEEGGVSDTLYVGVAGLAEVAAIKIVDAPGTASGFDVRLNLLDISSAGADFSLVRTLDGELIVATDPAGFSLTHTTSGVLTRHTLPSVFSRVMVAKDDAGRDVRAVFWQPGATSVALVDLAQIHSPLGIRPSILNLGTIAEHAQLLPAHRLLVTAYGALHLINVLDGTSFSLTTNELRVNTQTARVFDDVLFFELHAYEGGSLASPVIHAINLQTLDRRELQLAQPVTSMVHDAEQGLIVFSHPSAAGALSVVEFSNRIVGGGTYFWAQLAGGAADSSIFGG